jgi:hypothetical protein
MLQKLGGRGVLVLFLNERISWALPTLFYVLTYLKLDSKYDVEVPVSRPSDPRVIENLKNHESWSRFVASCGVYRPGMIRTYNS